MRSGGPAGRIAAAVPEDRSSAKGTGVTALPSGHTGKTSEHISEKNPKYNSEFRFKRKGLSELLTSIPRRSKTEGGIDFKCRFS
jgi:hypothetical protein